MNRLSELCKRFVNEEQNLAIITNDSCGVIHLVHINMLHLHPEAVGPPLGSSCANGGISMIIDPTVKDNYNEFVYKN